VLVSGHIEAADRKHAFVAKSQQPIEPGSEPGHPVQSASFVQVDGHVSLLLVVDVSEVVETVVVALEDSMEVDEPREELALEDPLRELTLDSPLVPDADEATVDDDSGMHSPPLQGSPQLSLQSALQLPSGTQTVASSQPPSGCVTTIPPSGTGTCPASGTIAPPS
jgi:hypothetical protein